MDLCFELERRVKKGKEKGPTTKKNFNVKKQEKKKKKKKRNKVVFLYKRRGCVR